MHPYARMVLATIGLLVTGPWAPLLAQTVRDTIVLDSVIAVEEARSPVGKYRIVFTTRAPLPQPTGTFPGVGILLDDRPVGFPPYASRGPLHFGYVEELPPGTVTLKAVSGPIDSAVPLEVLSQLSFQPAAMLENSRPAPGEYEPGHIRRSEGVVDLADSARTSRTVLIGVLLRRETHPLTVNLWRLYFNVEKTLYGPPGAADGEFVILKTARVSEIYELGGRYVLFLSQPPTAMDSKTSDPFRAVRVWWPDEDSVLEFLRTYQALGNLSNPDAPTLQRARDLFVAELRSPAAEVRRTAALELARLAVNGHKLAADEKKLLEERIRNEPSVKVKEALLALQESQSR